MTARTCLVGAGLILATAGPCLAQTAPAAAPRRPREFAVGGLFSGPASMGSSDASELGPSGAPSLTLFTTTNGFGVGGGVELMLGWQLRPALWFEVAGGLLKTTLRTRITDDFEGVADQTLSAGATRFSAEGALLWYLKDRGKTAWFVRAGGGVMREAAGDLSLADTGFIANGSIGYRHWWRMNVTGTFKRMGIRVEARGVLRAGGVMLGSRSVTFGPAGAVQLVFGY
jgi:hypothetical protein